MKRLVILIVVAFIASLTLSAQQVTGTQKQKEKQTKEQTRVQKEKQDNHGQTVSTVAKETPSGPGKGQVVSQTAKSNKEAKKVKKVNKEKKLKDARGPKVGQVPSRGPANSGGQGRK